MKEQLVMFILAFPSGFGGYQVCGSCIGRVTNESFSQWRCGEAVKITGIVVVIEMLLGCEEFRWKWRYVDESYIFEAARSDRILLITSQGCKIDEDLVVISYWASPEHSSPFDQPHCVKSKSS